jgi:hypothetical protein
MRLFRKEKVLNAWLIIFHLHDRLVGSLGGEEVLLSLNELSTQLLLQENQMLIRNKQWEDNKTFLVCFKNHILNCWVIGQHTLDNIMSLPLGLFIHLAKLAHVTFVDVWAIWSIKFGKWPLCVFSITRSFYSHMPIQEWKCTLAKMASTPKSTHKSTQFIVSFKKQNGEKHASLKTRWKSL